MHQSSSIFSEWKPQRRFSGEKSYSGEKLMFRALLAEFARMSDSSQMVAALVWPWHKRRNDGPCVEYQP